MVHVVAISDQHGILPEIPECDLLLITGDVCPVRMSHEPTIQREWLTTNYAKWLEEVPAEEKVLIAGNHDFAYQELPPAVLPAHYLEDSGISLFGFNIWGTPWTPWFYDWAFNAGRGPADGPEREKGLAEKYAQIPDDTDILLSHGPPYWYLDKNREGEHCGSRELLKRIKEITPRIVVFGHIHEDGLKKQPLGDTTLINASIVDRRYQHREAVMEFDLPLPRPVPED